MGFGYQRQIVTMLLRCLEEIHFPLTALPHFQHGNLTGRGPGFNSISCAIKIGPHAKKYMDTFFYTLARRSLFTLAT